MQRGWGGGCWIRQSEDGATGVRKLNECESKTEVCRERFWRLLLGVVQGDLGDTGEVGKTGEVTGNVGRVMGETD